MEVAMSKKCTPLWREAHFEVKTSEHLRCSKSVRSCGAKHNSKSECTKHHMFVPLLDVDASFCVAGARDSPPAKSEQNVRVLEFSKTMAGVRHFKRICKDGFRVAGAVQETCSSEMLGGQGRGVAFWSIRSSGLLMILHNRCSILYDLASLFPGRRNTLDRWGSS